MDSQVHEFIDQLGNKTKFNFYDVTGEVLDVNFAKNAITSVSGSKGNVSSETSIQSTTSLILKLSNGTEWHQALNFEFPSRNSHKVSIIFIQKTGEQTGMPVAAFNHSVNKLFHDPKPAYPIESLGKDKRRFWVAGGLAVLSFTPFFGITIPAALIFAGMGVHALLKKPYINIVAPPLIPAFVEKLKAAEEDKGESK